MLLGPIVDADIEEWRRMMEINVMGLMYCTHAAMPHLLRAAKDGPSRLLKNQAKRPDLGNPRLE
jgi:NAD(P)-dependent dehydrogenase (short-subunit alcohol dehydrogenase family)